MTLHQPPSLLQPRSTYQVSQPASQSAPAQPAPAQVNLPASQSAPAQVNLPASQSAPAQVNLPASQSAPAQVNLPASQSAPAQVNLPASQSAPPRQPPTTAILIDSNGKLLVRERLFPRHQVYKFWCPTTESAMQLLSQTRIDTPDNIIIHTGTNYLYAKCENVSGAVRRVAERAQAMFPTTNVVVSLPRKYFPGQLIDKINQQITVDCASLLNVRTAHHPTLTCELLYDNVHLDQVSVRTFAKDLKDATLGRDPHTHHPSSSGPPLHLLKQQYPHHPQERRARHSLLQHSSTRPGPPQNRFTRPDPAHPNTALLYPAHHNTALLDPAHHNTALLDPAHHNTALLDPAHHNTALLDPAHHNTALLDPAHHNTALLDPAHHNTALLDPA
ncbi:unnamed protein product [Coregonus sp. 'balchen']|nr:unnamed protein product [Coregonus sp. 'balchen']